MTTLIIGIDASNIITGGGITHLNELLKSIDSTFLPVKEIIIWGGKSTLAKIQANNKTHFSHQPLLDSTYSHRYFWQKYKLEKLAHQAKIDILFVPGGYYPGKFRPYVTMSQNLTPFEPSTKKLYGLSLIRLRLFLLKLLQTSTFKSAAGTVFLSNYAKERVLNQIPVKFKSVIVPHGVDSKFFRKPRKQKEPNEYSSSKPFKFLYISIIDMYKHQWTVLEAFSDLKQRNLPVSIDFVGPSYKYALKKFHKAKANLDPENRFSSYLGEKNHEELLKLLENYDGFIFASSCETFGLILLEGMAAGFPIACSNRSAMPEILKDAGFYFDPEAKQSIVNALEEMLNSPKEREIRAQKAFEYAKNYSWEKCAQDTFKFIQDAYSDYKSEQKH